MTIRTTPYDELKAAIYQWKDAHVDWVHSLHRKDPEELSGRYLEQLSEAQGRLMGLADRLKGEEQCNLDSIPEGEW